MEEKLFDNWDLIYDSNENIRLRATAFNDDKDKPDFIKEVSTEDLKAKVGSGSLYHIEFKGTFELVVHAVKGDEVYISFFEKATEYSWKRVESFVLSRNKPKKTAEIVYFGKSCGYYSVELY